PAQCVECGGMAHADMRTKLCVDSPVQFGAWVASQKAPPVEPGGAAPESAAAGVAASAQPARGAGARVQVAAAAAATTPATPAAEGKKIFSQSACIGCHTIQNISFGIVGPNLTHFASRTSFAGAIYERTDENLAH